MNRQLASGLKLGVMVLTSLLLTANDASSQPISAKLTEICPAWQVPELPASFRAPLRSTVPTLFISGTFDGRTPPDNVEETMKGFPSGQQVIIEGAGHGNELFTSSPRIQEVMVEFMKTGTVARRTIPLPPLEFKPIVSTERKK